MKKHRNTLALFIAAGMFFTASCSALATDIYLVYSGKDKGVSKELKKALPSDLKVKSYNVDLLAMADYSGKQKAIAKLSRAKLVVLIKEKPKEVLGEAKFPAVIEVDGSKGDVDAIVAKLKES